MNREGRDPESAMQLAEYFSSPRDQDLKIRFSKLTEDYIRKIKRIDPAKLEEIDEARREFESSYKLEINYCIDPKHSWDEEKPPEVKASLTRAAAAGIVEELFTHLNMAPVVEVQKRPNGFWDKLRQRTSEPPKPLDEWQRGKLMEAAFGAITYAADKSKLHTGKAVKPELLHELRKGIQGWHEDAKENFPKNIGLFVDNPQQAPQTDIIIDVKV